MTEPKFRSEQIAALNDDFRKHCAPPGTSSGKVVLTVGVNALGGDAVIKVLGLVAAFNSFTPDNDPHNEHDFGVVEYDGERLFWKIDYYDFVILYGSEDPTDANRTTRILTVMLAEEY